jgi:hypothetical protein
VSESPWYTTTIVKYAEFTTSNENEPDDGAVHDHQREFSPYGSNIWYGSPGSSVQPVVSLVTTPEEPGSITRWAKTLLAGGAANEIQDIHRDRKHIRKRRAFMAVLRIWL